MANSHVIQLPPEKNGFDGAEFRATLKAVDAKQPDPAAVAKLEKYFFDFPQLLDVSLHKLTLERIADRVGGTRSNAISQLAHYEQVKLGLGYATAPPLEKLLIDHIVLCHVRLNDTEWSYDRHTSGKLTLAQGDFWERKLNQAQQRYLKAIETLARVRKLNINIQVNIGDKQVITG